MPSGAGAPLGMRRNNHRAQTSPHPHAQKLPWAWHTSHPHNKISPHDLTAPQNLQTPQHPRPHPLPHILLLQTPPLPQQRPLPPLVHRGRQPRQGPPQLLPLRMGHHARARRTSSSTPAPPITPSPPSSPASKNRPPTPPFATSAPYAPEFAQHMQHLSPTGEVTLRFWQRGGGYDTNLWTPKFIHEKIAYIHNNPVERNSPRPKTGPGPAPRLRKTSHHTAPPLGPLRNPMVKTRTSGRVCHASGVGAPLGMRRDSTSQAQPLIALSRTNFPPPPMPRNSPGHGTLVCPKLLSLRHSSFPSAARTLHH